MSESLKPNVFAVWVCNKCGMPTDNQNVSSDYVEKCIQTDNKEYGVTLVDVVLKSEHEQTLNKLGELKVAHLKLLQDLVNSERETAQKIIEQFNQVLYVRRSSFCSDKKINEEIYNIIEKITIEYALEEEKTQ